MQCEESYCITSHIFDENKCKSMQRSIYLKMHFVLSIYFSLYRHKLSYFYIGILKYNGNFCNAIFILMTNIINNNFKKAIFLPRQNVNAHERNSLATEAYLLRILLLFPFR